MTEAELVEFRAWHNAWKPATRGLGPVVDKTISNGRSRALNAMAAFVFAFMAQVGLATGNSLGAALSALAATLMIGMMVLPQRKDNGMMRAALGLVFFATAIAIITDTIASVVTSWP